MTIKNDYASPRWSGEIADCSMPMTFDTYSLCSYNCLYCFSYFQKSNTRGVSGYLERKPASVNVDKVKGIFLSALGYIPPNPKNQFAPYIKNRITMQWGGLSDGFDEYERKHGVSLQLLKFFDEIDYPLSISTKGVWWTEDERYMSLIRKHRHNWHFKISIITLDPFKARLMERGVESPERRIQAIKNLADAGISVTLRLRPFMPGLSTDYRQLIIKAKEAGADSVTVEYFCLESRARPALRKKYDEISRICGLDIYELYRTQSKGAGYRRLNREYKEKTIKDIRELAHTLGMRFYVSDAHHKEKSDHCCCCGVPPEWRVARGHFAEALQIAKRNPEGLVYWKDIAADLKLIVGDVFFVSAAQFNTSSNRAAIERYNQTLYDLLREYWNKPKNSRSPYSYFAGALYPVGIDEEKNVIYKINQEMIA